MDSSVKDKAPEAVQRSGPLRWVWQIGIAFAGILTIIVGIILLPLPGPGSVVIYAGIGILATEFIWAKQLFAWIGKLAKQLLLRVRVWVKQMSRSEKP